jgi:hypothetical protein
MRTKLDVISRLVWRSEYDTTQRIRPIMSDIVATEQAAAVPELSLLLDNRFASLSSVMIAATMGIQYVVISRGNQ